MQHHPPATPPSIIAGEAAGNKHAHGSVASQEVPNHFLPPTPSVTERDRSNCRASAASEGEYLSSKRPTVWLLQRLRFDCTLPADSSGTYFKINDTDYGPNLGPHGPTIVALDHVPRDPDQCQFTIKCYSNGLSRIFVPGNRRADDETYRFPNHGVYIPPPAVPRVGPLSDDARAALESIGQDGPYAFAIVLELSDDDDDDSDNDDTRASVNPVVVLERDTIPPLLQAQISVPEAPASANTTNDTASSVGYSRGTWFGVTHHGDPTTLQRLYAPKVRARNAEQDAEQHQRDEAGDSATVEQTQSATSGRQPNQLPFVIRVEPQPHEMYGSEHPGASCPFTIDIRALQADGSPRDLNVGVRRNFVPSDSAAASDVLTSSRYLSNLDGSHFTMTSGSAIKRIDLVPVPEDYPAVESLS